MGASFTSREPTLFIQIDPTEHANLIESTQNFHVFQNSEGVQFQKYIVRKEVEQKNFLQSKLTFEENYQSRLIHKIKYFVQLLYAAPRQNSFQCNFNRSEEYDVVTERIVFRLSQIYNLSFLNAIKILNITLKGFQNLYSQHGLFWIKDSMIGINQQNQIKVWLNFNFGLNTIEPLPLALRSLPQQLQQDMIVNKLIDLISSKTFPSVQWKWFMKLRMDKMNQKQIVGRDKQISINNKMNFKKALEIVDVIFEKFGFHDAKQQNKVAGLFNQIEKYRIFQEEINDYLHFNENQSIKPNAKVLEYQNRFEDQYKPANGLTNRNQTLKNLVNQRQFINPLPQIHFKQQNLFENNFLQRQNFINNNDQTIDNYINAKCLTNKINLPLTFYGPQPQFRNVRSNIINADAKSNQNFHKIKISPHRTNRIMHHLNYDNMKKSLDPVRIKQWPAIRFRYQNSMNAYRNSIFEQRSKSLQFSRPQGLFQSNFSIDKAISHKLSAIRLFANHDCKAIKNRSFESRQSVEVISNFQKLFNYQNKKLSLPIDTNSKQNQIQSAKLSFKIKKQQNFQDPILFKNQSKDIKFTPQKKALVQKQLKSIKEPLHQESFKAQISRDLINNQNPQNKFSESNQNNPVVKESQSLSVKQQSHKVQQIQEKSNWTIASYKGNSPDEQVMQIALRSCPSPESSCSSISNHKEQQIQNQVIFTNLDLKQNHQIKVQSTCQKKEEFYSNSNQILKVKQSQRPLNINRPVQKITNQSISVKNSGSIISSSKEKPQQSSTFYKFEVKDTINQCSFKSDNSASIKTPNIENNRTNFTSMIPNAKLKNLVSKQQKQKEKKIKQSNQSQSSCNDSIHLTYKELRNLLRSSTIRIFD